jgi:DNA (cytosine-5)-methyltransferase 1
MVVKVLNLYAGIGGNRKLWKNVDVTAIEYNPDIARVYRDFFPDDTVLGVDAHEFLLHNYKRFDFIWSSPPCPTHSVLVRSNIHHGLSYPDMDLYQEILLLKHFFKGKYCVENVISYYDPLVPPQTLHRHYFWANFYIPYKTFPITQHSTKQDRVRFEKLYGFDLEKYNGFDKRWALRNCVMPEVGLYIFGQAFNQTQTTLSEVIR